MNIAKVFHADHGISNDLILSAVMRLKPEEGFSALTLELEEACVMSALYGPKAGDGPVTDAEVDMVKRSEDRPPSRMVDKPKRPSSKLTVVGVRSGEAATIYTAYGGPLAPREPGDASMTTDAEKAESAAFWAEHALASR
jgi:hypothetical protein